MSGEQDIVQLPFKIVDFNEDMLVALHRNFKEIERHLAFLQMQIKTVTGGGVGDLEDAAKIWDRAGNITEDGTFLTEKLEGLIEELQIADAAVSELKLKDLAVTSVKLAENAVLMDKIADAAVDANKLADLAVEMAKIADGAVSTDKIAPLAITIEKIADAAVGTDKIAANAIIADKIAANAVTADKITANAVTADKVAANAVTADKVAANAITAGKIAADAVGANAIAAGVIAAGHLGANSVTSEKIYAGAVTAEKIGAGAVVAEKIAAGAVTADKVNVNELSAISSNIGHILAGTIDASVVRVGYATQFEEGYDPSRKIVTFSQSTSPTADGVGDLWIHTGNNNRLHRWNGSSWVDIHDKVVDGKFDKPGYMLATDNGVNVHDGYGTPRAFWGQYATGKFGGKVMHADGSYTTLSYDGLLRHIANQNKNYLFMVHGGEETTYNFCWLTLKRWLTWDGPHSDPTHNLDGSAFYPDTRYYTYLPYCNYARDWFPAWDPGDPNYVKDWNYRFGAGDGVNDNGMDYITEEDIAEWVTDKWIYLPDEWRGINYTIILSVKEYEMPMSFEGKMTDGRKVAITTAGSPKFVLKVLEKRLGNKLDPNDKARFKVRAYYEIRNKWETEHFVPNYWAPNQNFVETDQVFYAQGITFSYVVIA